MPFVNHDGDMGFADYCADRQGSQRLDAKVKPSTFKSGRTPLKVGFWEALSTVSMAGYPLSKIYLCQLLIKRGPA